MNEPLDPMVLRQLELEADMRAQGSRKFREEVLLARQHGRESETKYGQSLMARAIIPVAEGITAFLRELEQNGRAQRLSIAGRLLALLEPEVAAFIATKGVLDGITTRSRMSAVAVRIGNMIEDEVRFQALAEARRINPATGKEEKLDGYFHVVTENLNAQSAHYVYKRKVIIGMARKMGVEWNDWSKTDKLHLGVKLIEIVQERTGVVEQTMFVNRKKTEYYLSATPVTTEWINGKNNWDELMCALYQPMIVPPVDWTKPIGGGYLGGTAEHPLKQLKLVKTHNKAYFEELFSTDLSGVYGPLNAIQRTAWKVNGPVLQVMVEAWRATVSPIGGLPSRENTPLPTKPIDIETNKEARKLWKRAASQTIRGNFRLGSKRLQVDQIIRTAEKFAPEKAIYFPHTLDFRGRVYAVPIGLNPQGHDIAKGLLTFANGKPLLDQRAADWLAIHGANTFGFDKVSLEERVAWVRENEVHILRSAAAPLDYHWWEQADKPWQFLAFCFEWAGFKQQGFGFVSCLPIALDGSCNGLQHFSAMLRDAVGGAAVNLTPSETPQDIYQKVADKVIEKLAADGSPQAAKWLAFGVTRKLTKRPVMVVPYGGTRHSCRDYVMAHVKEKLQGVSDGDSVVQSGGMANYGTDKELFHSCAYLSGLVWDSISEIVVAARDAMGWLQKVSQVVSKVGHPITWTAPTGFKVQQAYPNVTSHIVKTRIGGSLVYFSLDEEKDTLDKRRQAQGISPNFVHSLDAAALMFTVDTATQYGLESFAMIHDSYGTLAADTDALRECLRSSFCGMYQTDVLAQFRDEIQKGLPDGVKLPPLPKKGTLDINQVLQSDFFFA